MTVAMPMLVEEVVPNVTVPVPGGTWAKVIAAVLSTPVVTVAPVESSMVAVRTVGFPTSSIVPVDEVNTICVPGPAEADTGIDWATKDPRPVTTPSTASTSTRVGLLN